MMIGHNRLMAIFALTSTRPWCGLDDEDVDDDDEDWDLDDDDWDDDEDWDDEDDADDVDDPEHDVEGGDGWD